jgi:glycosyltransferase involved in cell wall biosynthesis
MNGSRRDVTPSIAAMVGVQNERTLIERSVSHLRSIGVDFILLFDTGSTDGTLERLETMSGASDVIVVRVDPNETSPFSPANVDLVRSTGAEWIMFQDADEFWVPTTHRLADAAVFGDADVVIVPRYNVPLTRSGVMCPPRLSPSHHAELFLSTQTIPDLEHSPERQEDTPWSLAAPIGPKVMARLDRVGGVVAGGHDVLPADGSPLRRLVARDVLIAHVPFTTFDRFEAKVAGIVEFKRRHPEFFAEGLGWHWARWAAQREARALDDEFQRQILEDDTVRALIAEGAIRSAASIFAERA